MALTKVSGSILKNPLSLSGNVSVGGTLTYEDVTNVDAVGVVTARTGIKVLAGGINAVGVVTATDFKKADGSSVGAATQVTIGVRSGSAVTFSATGSSFNVVGRSGNIPISI
tara:strand:+ start:96 stop:431 length:336 start_codon:yes stop_codon:yes gene_type:complete